MKNIVENRWRTLRQFTQARIGLGRAGHALPTHINLQFQLDHARARDAVHLALDTQGIARGLDSLGLQVLELRSRAGDRATYLQRPDLGRRLSEADHTLLMAKSFPECDVALIIADGLSSTAVNQHAIPFVQRLVPALVSAGFSLAPLCLVSQGRVGVGDDIGLALNARLSVVIIGERPGLSSPDSLGIYLTFAPRPGRQDSERNCISNIRPPQGQGYPQAVDTCVYLCRHALQRGLSGVDLKDDSMTLEQSSTDSIPFLKPVE